MLYFDIFTVKTISMSSDFIKDLGYKALDSRFKRISDRMAHDVRKLYKELRIDVEPNWYLVFMLLQKSGEISMVTIADALGYAHPSVVALVKKMSNKGYVLVKKDQADKRKQMVSLSPKAVKLLPQLEQIWHSCENAILELLSDDLAILQYLDQIDAALKNTSFHQRFKQSYLKTNES